MTTIIYIYTKPTTFVLRDMKYLSEHFRIIVRPFKVKRKIFIILDFLNQFFWILMNSKKFDLVICQFSGHHSIVPVALARLLGKPSIILANGTDCVSFPSLDYGHFRKYILSRTTRWSFALADMLVPLHRSLVYCEPTYHQIGPNAQGILNYCPGLKTPIRPLPYGFNAELWSYSGVREGNRFITVATDAHKNYVKIIKGLDMIIEVARIMKDCNFYIVGANGKSFSDKPMNVYEIPYVPNDEISAFYGRSSFYLQLSVSEGFGNALCEAMLCGCIPIVSDVGAMPEIVGDAGVVVQKRDVNKIVKAISEAMEMDGSKGAERARSQIVRNYPEKIRRDGLKEIVDSVLGNKPSKISRYDRACS